jgi:transposase
LILLANSILDRISFEVVIEGESDVGVVDRLGVIPILDLWRIAMSLQPREIPPVPEETQRVARAAFPKGNVYVHLRDEIGTIFDDPLFAPWFPTRGQPAESPWCLALITVMQFVEGLSDRQAAEAVRARIDWKYALSLELTDPGGDASVPCEFRALLAAIYAPAAPAWLRELPAVQTLRQAWVHQFLIEDDVVRWRKAADLPPASTRFDSPYDTDARYSSKCSTVHVTETCGTDAPHLIVHVETTPAPVTVSDLTAPIQQALVDKGLAPATHLADAGYVDADLLVTSQTQHGIELLGPVRPDVSWQAKAGQGFDLAAFIVDWESKKVICPTGQTSVDWTPARDHWGNDTIHVGFHRPTCAVCKQPSPLHPRQSRPPRNHVASAPVA